MTMHKCLPDSNFQVEKHSQRSTSRLVFNISGRAILLRSVKQGCIVDSTMEPEYVPTCEEIKEGI